MSTLNQIQKVKQQIVDLREARGQIIAASTVEKLKRLDSEASGLREMLASLERVQSSATSNATPSEEETALWAEIRELGDREINIQREKLVPEKFIRADALAFFQGDLKARRATLEKNTAGMKYNQSHGPRILDQLSAMQDEEENFATRVKPLALAGQKIHGLREKKRELLARRDELKAQRESKILANV